jgi:isoquinoline 1-oxidoreductase alpha subunit
MTAKARVTLKVNRRTYTVDVNPDTPVLWVLHDELGRVGTKHGRGVASCGACTIHLNGQALRSCVLPVASAAGAEITTIEGLSDRGDHPVQRAWQPYWHSAGL